jgi:hypothetical protein
MRQKSELRLRAEALRREEGLSYKEIKALTGISLGTLSGWLKHIELSPEHEQRLQARLQANRGAFAARALPINRARHQQARDAAYAAGAAVTAALPDDRGVHELALAMLYAGEGTKRSGHFEMANTNPDVLRYFLWALRHLYGVEEARLSYRLNLVEGARASEASHKAWWCEQLGCQVEQLKKSQFDGRKPTAVITGDYHGVCTISVNDTWLQVRTLGLAWTYMQQMGGKKNETAE